jgi:TetR/AcrR family transcriptional regulator, mexJK operon transcriptional repressor
MPLILPYGTEMPKRIASGHERRRKARRAAILQIARDMFFRQGFAATSMSEISTAMGGSKGTLWAHFACKEDLFEAVMDDATSKFHAELDAVFSAGGGQRETLEMFSVRMLEMLVAPEVISLNRVIIAESERFPQIGSIFFSRGPGRVIERLSQFLQIEEAAGRMELPLSPEAAARHLLALLHAPQQRLLWDPSASVDMGRVRQQAIEGVAMLLGISEEG